MPVTDLPITVKETSNKLVHFMRGDIPAQVKTPNSASLPPQKPSTTKIGSYEEDNFLSVPASPISDIQRKK